MHRFRPALLVIGACVASLALLAAGCGDDDDGASGNTTATETASPLPMEQRVLADSLGGLEPTGPVRVVSSPEEFTAAVDSDTPQEDIAALTEAGFQEGAVVSYGDDERTFGISAAIRYGDAEAAESERDRIFDELASDPPPGSERGELEGVPGSRTIRATVTEEGERFSFASVFFNDGPFLYGQIAGGPEASFDPEALEADASRLYEEVRGRPAP